MFSSASRRRRTLWVGLHETSLQACSLFLHVMAFDVSISIVVLSCFVGITRIHLRCSEFLSEQFHHGISLIVKPILRQGESDQLPSPRIQTSQPGQWPRLDLPARDRSWKISQKWCGVVKLVLAADWLQRGQLSNACVLEDSCEALVQPQRTTLQKPKAPWANLESPSNPIWASSRKKKLLSGCPWMPLLLSNDLLYM